MADIIDIAQEAIEACTEEAQRRARKQAARETHPNFDGVTCVDCGSDVEPARLGLGKVRCISCQQDLETRRKTRIGWIPEDPT